LNKILLILFILGCGITIADDHIEQRTQMKTLICSSHDFVSNDLINEHEQHRKWYAVTNRNEIVELYVNEETGFWTIITTGTDKIACGLIGGDASSFIE